MSRRSMGSTTFEQLADSVKGLDEPSSECTVETVAPLAHVFMNYWDSNDAAAAMSYLKYMEIRTKLRMLQQEHGCWHPPPEVAKYMTKRPKPLKFTHLANSKDERNLKFVLYILGVSPHDDRPYKQFLKAKTIRQRRYWLYKHMGPAEAAFEMYREPICETRLRRLYQFFPEQFKDEDGIIYFNNKMLLYNETSNLFFLGTRPTFELECHDEPDSLDTAEILTWRSD